MTADEQQSLRSAYDQLCQSYRAIDDFRAKLLGLLPLVTGGGLVLLTKGVKDINPDLFLPVGVFGAFVTFGLLSYEIYDIRKCHALIIAGGRLEARLGLGAGQFIARPREVWGVLNEPFAAAIIYPAVIAAWIFLATYSPPASPLGLAISVFALGFAVILGYNLWLKWEDSLKEWWHARHRRSVRSWLLERRPLTSPRACRRLRALRQRLFTACCIGDSRDVAFALYSFPELLDYYCVEARRPKDGKLFNEILRGRPSKKYSSADGIISGSWRVLPGQTIVSYNDIPVIGWFGNEFGRALVRCAENGIHSGSLTQCDLDHILTVLSEAALQLAGFKPSKRRGIADAPQLQPLSEEAGFLLDQIAEIGIYAYQIEDNAYRDWSARAAIILADLENKLEKFYVRTTSRLHLASSSEPGEHPNGSGHYLAGRSLAAWCLVNYVFQQSKDSACSKNDPSVYGLSQLGEQARSDPQLWSEAMGFAMRPGMHPCRMSPVRDDPDVQQRLNMFLDTVKTRVTAGHNPRPWTGLCRQLSTGLAPSLALKRRKGSRHSYAELRPE